MPFNT